MATSTTGDRQLVMGRTNPGQALAIWDPSTTTLTTSVATGLTSVARSDYAGNGFSYTQLSHDGSRRHLLRHALSAGGVSGC